MKQEEENDYASGYSRILDLQNKYGEGDTNINKFINIVYQYAFNNGMDNKVEYSIIDNYARGNGKTDNILSLAYEAGFADGVKHVNNYESRISSKKHNVINKNQPIIACHYDIIKELQLKHGKGNNKVNNLIEVTYHVAFADGIDNDVNFMICDNLSGGNNKVNKILYNVYRVGSKAGINY